MYVCMYVCMNVCICMYGYIHISCLTGVQNCAYLFGPTSRPKKKGQYPALLLFVLNIYGYIIVL